MVSFGVYWYLTCIWQCLKARKHCEMTIKRLWGFTWFDVHIIYISICVKYFVVKSNFPKAFGFCFGDSKFTTSKSFVSPSPYWISLLSLRAIHPENQESGTNVVRMVAKCISYYLFVSIKCTNAQNPKK